MNTHIITFKYEGQPANKPGVKYSNLDLLSEVIELLKTGGVAMTGWENTEHFKYDSSVDLLHWYIPIRYLKFETFHIASN